MLKLYATSRHLEPPGTIIFTTDDLVLQLNQTIQKSSKQKVSPIHVLKHPKMRLNKIVDNNRKQMKLNSADNAKVANINVDKKRMEMDKILRQKNQDRKMMSIERVAPSKIEKPFIYMPSRYEDRDNNIYVK